ncbi:interleukin 21 receptor, tandem duplicate 2 [Myxocyprinus asiaticus]|uniref:interleukin 21 receptor, tandem duplicate 2 n=1 Tax=Myxocyprinus asiaticus TaxID=70543 RepID=UPI002221F12F|nr:interleukin 21 receptor, tandem duplicate 2 [Myxocyprinus asiaticus]
MNLTGIFCILLAFPLQPKASSHALPDGYTCVTDYWLTINCSLKIPVTPARATNRSYWLKFDQNKENVTFECALQRAYEDYSCTYSFEEKAFSGFMDIDQYTITLFYLENGQNNSLLLESSYYPAKNIKPKPPDNFMFQYANGTYHFKWQSGYEHHVYGKVLPFMYEFLYYKEGDRGSEVIAHPEMLQIDELKLVRGAQYTAMVRTGIDQNHFYNGTLSDWSIAIKWKTTLEDQSNQVGRIAIITCLMLGFLILLLSVPVARMKIKEIAWVPTPATYFQPLYQHYQGNFQCWVLAKSPIQDVCVMEEFSTIDKIAEAKTTLQDYGEKTDVHPSAQCYTAYVGPTAAIWAPFQTTDVCSETSIPCEELSLSCEELPDQVDDLIQCLSTVCCSGDVLSLKNSVLSLESSESCGSSEAPAIINPTPVCFKQDYCTLTDTPQGPVPTFTKDAELDGNTSTE